MRRALFLVAAVLGAIGFTGPPAGSPRDGADLQPFPGPLLPAPYRPETPSDPPAAPGALARTRWLAPAAAVTRGGFVSVQVNVDASGNDVVGDAANEPSLAVDPGDPQRIAVGWRQFDSVSSNFRQAGWAYSTDAGVTWNPGGVLEPGIFRSDPVLASDPAGVFYYASLTAVSDDCPGGTCTTEGLAVDVFRSTDGGASFPEKVAAFGGDKQWIGVGREPTSMGLPVYQIWTSLFSCTSPPAPAPCPPESDFTRSIDGGASYELPISLPRLPGILGSVGIPIWSTLDVADDGSLRMVGRNLSAPYRSSPFHILYRSSNPSVVGEDPTIEGPFGLHVGGSSISDAGPNPGGLLGQPWILSAPGSSPFEGSVQVVASVDPPGPDPLDLLSIRSPDGGDTWSAPVRINDDPPGSRAWQWFGTASVAPDARIDVVWNDTRADPGGLRSELRYAYSTDAGATWSASLPVTPTWDPLLGHPNQRKIGDYYHMVSDEDGAALAYAATFAGEQNVYFLRVGDCDGNGRHDATDVALGPGRDCDANGILDECEEDPPCDPCAAHEQCSDGLFCNGLEICEAGECAAAAVPCGARACDEALDACIEPLHMEVRGTVDFVTCYPIGICPEPSDLPLGPGDDVRAVFVIDPSTPDQAPGDDPSRGYFEGAVLTGRVELGSEVLADLNGRFAYVETSDGDANDSFLVRVNWLGGDRPEFPGPSLGVGPLTYADALLLSGPLAPDVLADDRLALERFRLSPTAVLGLGLSSDSLEAPVEQFSWRYIEARQLELRVPEPSASLQAAVAAAVLWILARRLRMAPPRASPTGRAARPRSSARRGVRVARMESS